MEEHQYLYYDLETEGLDPNVHRILEVAAIAVTEDMQIRASWSDVVKITGPVNFSSEFVKTMHTQSGLVDDLPKATRTIAQVDKELREFLDLYYPSNVKIILAGHSPHAVDRTFTLAYMPLVSERLSHRVHDTGALVRAYQRRGNKHFKSGEVLGHRARDDAFGAFDEDLRLMNEWNWLQRRY